MALVEAAIERPDTTAFPEGFFRPDQLPEEHRDLAQCILTSALLALTIETLNMLVSRKGNTMRRLVVGAVLALAIGVIPAAGSPKTFADQGGNSAAAHACQQGGYATIVGGMPPSNTVSFSNTGQCVSYAARGGQLFQVSTTSVFVDATINQFQDTGVNLASGAVASITATGTAYAGGCSNGQVMPGPCSMSAVGPNGLGGSCGTCLASGLPYYSLVGQVGGGSPVEIGSGPTTVTGPGEVRLAFNDGSGNNCTGPGIVNGNCYSDNAGGFTATFTTYTPIS